MQEEQRTATRFRAVHWACIVALLCTAALWSRAADYDVLVRFTVASGAILVTRYAFLQREYRWTAAFATATALYNPVFPQFALEGSVAFGMVVATAVLFGASLALTGRLDDAKPAKVLRAV